MKILNILFCLLLGLLPGCWHSPSSGGGGTNPPASGASLSFKAVSKQATSTSAAPRVVAAAAAMADVVTPDTIFNFGNIPSTQDYLFELRNNGTNNLINVSIVASDATVIVTPQTIGVIPVFGTGSVTSLISAQVIHGRGANGYGTAPNLPQGPYSFTLTATGEDAVTHATVTATAEVDLNALVANFTVAEVDTDSLGGTYGPNPVTVDTNRTQVILPYVTDMPYNGWATLSYLETLSAPPDPGLPRHWVVTNTGNCPLYLSNYGFPDDAGTAGVFPTETITVPVGESRNVTLMHSNSFPQANLFSSLLIIDTHNVVFNQSLPLPDYTSRMYFQLRFQEM